MTTLEAKQAELDAVQLAFDEYIVSSRELEDELDAELTKCQNDLANAESRNTALVSQLSNVTPQLTALENKLSNLTSQLQQESQRRIAAELLAEESQNKLRESEGSLAAVRSSEMKKLKEDLEDLHERLAFAEGEAEDYRYELESERERHREELEEIKGDVEVLKNRLKEKEALLGEYQNSKRVLIDRVSAEEKKPIGNSDEIFGDEEKVEGASSSRVERKEKVESWVESDREDYIRTLEDELELVTEQLIEAESKLSRTEAQLEEALTEAEEAHKALEKATISGNLTQGDSETVQQHKAKIAELESTIQLLKDENVELVAESRRLQEELELAQEELNLAKEEFEATMEDNRVQSEEFQLERKQYREELAAMQSQLDKVSSEDRAKEIESKSWEDALVASEGRANTLQEEVARLELALENSKTDCAALQDEIDELKVAFDEEIKKDKLSGENEQNTLKELLATRTREVEELKQEVKDLNDTNSSLTSMVRDTEEALKKKRVEVEKQQHSAAIGAEDSFQKLQDAQDEIYSLEGLLESAKEELNDQRNEVANVRTTLQDQITRVQKELETAEKELEITRAQLAESECRPKRSISLSTDSKPTKKMARLSFSTVPSRRSRSEIGEEEASSESEFFRSHALSRRLYSHKSRSRPRSCSPTTIQRLECDAESRAAATTSLQKENVRLEDQNRMSVSMKNHLEAEIKELQKQLMDAKCSRPSVSYEGNDQSAEMIKIADTSVEDVLQTNNPDKIAEEFRLMAKKISAQKTHNAELLTKILKLQGNIQVCCRIRPMSLAESQRGLREVAQALSETELGCFDERTRTWKSYAFDRVWGPETQQKDVFQDVEPMALSVIDGYNACIFAYGQTGSGKTFTMEGDKSKYQNGISQRTIQKIFGILHDKAEQQQAIDNKSLPNFEFTIEVSLLEIYNDEVYDLLSPTFAINTKDGEQRRKSLDIRMNANENTVEVPNLFKEKVSTVMEVLDALDRGNSNRATASTNLNERSSRSHMIMQVEVTSGIGEAKNKGTLYLVDLAGSERVRKSEVEGKALKEAQHINKSLSALGNVMEALDRKASHIPYRDSKLTYLLQNSLGGNSRTMMVVTVCPHNDSYDESTFALKFATRVRRINLGSAHKNVTAKNLEETVKNLTSQMNLLSKAKERSESQILALKKEKERVEDKLSKVSVSRANSKDEMRTLSVMTKNNHEITARWQKEKSIREEKALELEKAQEELRRVQRDFSTAKREKEYLTKEMEDKENVIHGLRKELRSMKEQLNEEKIRHRRSQVMQSRIPAPSARSRATNNHKRQPVSAKPSTTVSRPTSRTASTASSKSNGMKNPTRTSDSNSSETQQYDQDTAREVVLKLLKQHDASKIGKIDAIMEKFSGREDELVDKMTSRYKNKNEGVEGDSGTSISLRGSIDDDDDRPKSRQDLALEKHLERMNRIKGIK